MKVAIHGSNAFAKRWPTSAEKFGCEVVIIDAYSPDLFAQIEDCDVLLWSLNHDCTKELKFARSILRSVQQAGLAVFPDPNTNWHFDDKVAQFYLLSAIDAPVVKTHVFFSLSDSEEFLRMAKLPLVFKLKSGAGSTNVKLVRSRRQARSIAKRMFGRGVRSFPVVERLKRGAKRIRSGTDKKRSIISRAQRGVRLWLRQTLEAHRERGYVLFQQFLRGNDHDLRVTVIGDRAFCFKRVVRENDFRASGSGNLVYLSARQIPADAIALAFEISQELSLQATAFDFLRERESGELQIVEMSCGFLAEAVEECPGYFTSSGDWVDGNFRPEDFILEDILARLDGIQD